MQANVSGLMLAGIGATRQFELDAWLRSDGREPERVAGDVELLRTKAGVLVRAHLNLVERETCSRCLTPLAETLKIDFEEEFQALVDVKSGELLRERPDPEAFLIDSNHILDLSEAVRQYREAAAEMKPLCRPDCRGLCPRCGLDLNQGDCGCDSGETDSRWAALLDLRGAISEGKE